MKQKTIQQLEEMARNRYIDAGCFGHEFIKKAEEKQITTQEKVEKMLYSRGIFESDAHKILEYAKIEIDNYGYKTSCHSEYKTSWHRPASEYDDGFFKMLFIVLRPYVVKWANTNKPKAWWLPYFKK